MVIRRFVNKCLINFRNRCDPCNKKTFSNYQPIMNLLQSAKREFYTIRQTLTEKNIIGKNMTYLGGVGGNSAVTFVGESFTIVFFLF